MTVPRVVVLVEGDSDRAALAAAARRGGHDLAGVEVVPMGGVTNTRAFAQRYGPPGLGLTLAGLYDAPDEAVVRRGLAAADLAPGEGAGLSSLGFFGCDPDLEGELVRAHGVAGVEAVVESAVESRSLARLSQMPAQAGWSREAVLRRFLGVRSGRKARYAVLLVETLPPDRLPRPLADLLSWVSGPAGRAGR